MSSPDPSPSASAAEVVVYRRSGCPYCTSLVRGLRSQGLPFREVDIWAVPDGAAFVRAAADGNETVPTVDIAGTVLVNPPVAVVLALAVRAGISVVPPEQSQSRWTRFA